MNPTLLLIAQYAAACFVLSVSIVAVWFASAWTTFRFLEARAAGSALRWGACAANAIGLAVGTAVLSFFLMPYLIAVWFQPTLGVTWFYSVVVCGAAVFSIASNLFSKPEPHR